MINVEIKAKIGDEQQLEIQEILKQMQAVYCGTDIQTDTYFKVQSGRLKLREGNIENVLVQYSRNNEKGPKLSKYNLTPVSDNIRESLKNSLTESLGVLFVVKKTRQIYFLENIKIHLDFLEMLGYFVEIEARDEKEILGIDFLTEQCNKLMKDFGIVPGQLLSNSYSDML